MKDSMIAKVVFFKDTKEFCGSLDGDLTDKLAEAYPFYEDDLDSSIISDMDKDCQEQAEVWKVKITVETISEE
jgi:hypothetical protein